MYNTQTRTDPARRHHHCDIPVTLSPDQRAAFEDAQPVASDQIAGLRNQGSGCAQSPANLVLFSHCGKFSHRGEKI